MITRLRDILIEEEEILIACKFRNHVESPSKLTRAIEIMIALFYLILMAKHMAINKKKTFVGNWIRNKLKMEID
jgi:hypothetical protein